MAKKELSFSSPEEALKAERAYSASLEARLAGLQSTLSDVQRSALELPHPHKTRSASKTLDSLGTKATVALNKFGAQDLESEKQRELTGTEAAKRLAKKLGAKREELKQISEGLSAYERAGKEPPTPNIFKSIKENSQSLARKLPGSADRLLSEQKDEFSLRQKAFLEQERKLKALSERDYETGRASDVRALYDEAKSALGEATQHYKLAVQVYNSNLKRVRSPELKKDAQKRVAAEVSSELKEYKGYQEILERRASLQAEIKRDQANLNAFQSIGSEKISVKESKRELKPTNPYLLEKKAQRVRNRTKSVAR